MSKVALVTAGSRGLGAEIVRTLARDGFDVAFTYLREEEAAGELAEEVSAMGRKSGAYRADAADFALAHEVVGKVLAEQGRLDALVCNAGIVRGGALWKLKEEDWDAVLGVSLKGAFNYLHAAAPPFMEQRSGRVVFIGSINGLRGRLGSASYNAAKAGLVGLMKSAAAELGRYEVTANLIAPGFIETPSQTTTPEIVRDLVLKECAIKRLGAPEDIAPVVGFLCSESARHITGQTIRVDGGQYL